MLTDERKQELCLQCMACCKVTHMPFHSPDKKKAKEFYETKGFKVKEYNGTQFLEIEGDCPQLTILGCKIYPVRPWVCKVYDGRNAPFIKDICLWKEE